MLTVHKKCAFDMSTDDWNNQSPPENAFSDFIGGIETISLGNDRFQVSWKLIIDDGMEVGPDLYSEELEAAWQFRNDPDRDCCILCGKEVVRS